MNTKCSTKWWRKKIQRHTINIVYTKHQLNAVWNVTSYLL